MTDQAAVPKTTKMPATIAEADKLIRPKVMIFTAAIGLLVVVTTICGPVLSIYLHGRYRSIIETAVGVLSGILIFGIFYVGSTRLAKTLIAYGRNFVALGKWEEAEGILTSFNQWGQRFLDPTGEGHYLLSVALMKRGKYETARKVQAFLLKHRATSEWAQKLQPVPNKPVAKATADGASEEKTPRPSKAKRRRY